MLNQQQWQFDYVISEQYLLGFSDQHAYRQVMTIYDRWGVYAGDMHLSDQTHWDFSLYLNGQHIEIDTVRPHHAYTASDARQLDIWVDSQLQAKVMIGSPFSSYRPYDLYSLQGLLPHEQEHLLFILATYEQFIQTYAQLSG